MFKFNFLSKINQEKAEQKKRNRLVMLIFSSSLFCVAGLLIVLYFNSMLVGSDYNDALSTKARIEERSRQFRTKDFFSYRNIQSTYNATTKRKKLTAIFDALESSADTTATIANFRLNDSFFQAVYVVKMTGSRSQLMNVANRIKDRLSEKLTELHYLDEKKPVRISTFPDVKNTLNEIQYWEFVVDVDLVGNVKQAPVKKSDETDAGDPNI